MIDLVTVMSMLIGSILLLTIALPFFSNKERFSKMKEWINSMTTRQKGLIYFLILFNLIFFIGIPIFGLVKLYSTNEETTPLSKQSIPLQSQQVANLQEPNMQNINVEAKKKILEAIKNRDLPDYVQQKLVEEVIKLIQMPSYSPESSLISEYVKVVLDLPWDIESKITVDITKAKKILDEDHYGLDKVKARILEYLAIRQLNKDAKGPIICLVGPPGVGKTSLAKSIAKSMNREFGRVSLGGVRDEAEIRGHRKTYMGSMPGRIIKELKRVGVNNPLLLLDEIDKVSDKVSNHGDPAAALLEALDPEQNKEFTDNYIDMPFDISKIFFIATANDISNMYPALRDRLEIIELSSYTDVEKLEIAKRYLIDKSKKESGLEDLSLKISDEIILKIINEYTREAGVRGLKREFDKIFRKIARDKIEGNKIDKTLNDKGVLQYLGVPKVQKVEQKKKEGKVGVVNGLAWTPVGGIITEVQSAIMPAISMGKPQVIATGQLGDVMLESTKVALSYVRSISDVLKIDRKMFSEKDLHMHFPAGGVSKDGPSAGIAITTSIISTLTGKKVRQDIAMTGEVTIKGEVLPIGGVKEKAIGAYRAGIKEIIFPIDNKANIEDIPEEVRKNIKIHFAKDYMKDVINKVLL